MSDDDVAGALASTPLPRLGIPGDLAEATAFLASASAGLDHRRDARRRRRPGHALTRRGNPFLRYPLPEARVLRTPPGCEVWSFPRCAPWRR
jgi:hypothetical protein